MLRLRKLTTSVVPPFNRKCGPATCESGRLGENRAREGILHRYALVCPRAAIDRTLDIRDGRRAPGKAHAPEIRQGKDVTEERGFDDPFRRGALGGPFLGDRKPDALREVGDAEDKLVLGNELDLGADLIAWLNGKLREEKPARGIHLKPCVVQRRPHVPILFGADLLHGPVGTAVNSHPDRRRSFLRAGGSNGRHPPRPSHIRHGMLQGKG